MASGARESGMDPPLMTGTGIMTRFARLGLAGAMAMMLAAGPATAQFSDSYNFLKAVKDRDGNKATDLISRPGTVIIDTKAGPR